MLPPKRSTPWDLSPTDPGVPQPTSPPLASSSERAAGRRSASGERGFILDLGGPRGGLRPAPRVGRIIGSFVQTASRFRRSILVLVLALVVGASALVVQRAAETRRRVRLGGGPRRGRHLRLVDGSGRPAASGARRRRASLPRGSAARPGAGRIRAPLPPARGSSGRRPTSSNAVLNAPPGKTFWLEPGVHHRGRRRVRPADSARMASPSSAPRARFSTARSESTSTPSPSMPPVSLWST